MACSLHLERLGSRMAIACVAAMLAASAIAAPWTLDGPADGGQAPSSGAIATHPLVGGQAMIVAGFVPGIAPSGTFYTADGGAHWASNARHGGSGRPILGGSPTVAYVGDDGRILRSADQGRSWASLTLPFATFQPPPPLGPARLGAVNPADGNELVVSGGNRVMHSLDGGSTWSQDTAPSGITALVVDWSTRTIFATLASGATVGHRPLDTPGAWGTAGNDAAVLAAGHGVAVYQSSAGGLFRSTDGGISFQPVLQAPGKVALCDLAFAAAPSSRVYGLECTSRRILHSANDGAGFSVVGVLPLGIAGASIAVDAANPAKVYVATSRGVLESTNSGASFAPLLRSTGAPGLGRVLVIDQRGANHRWLTDLPGAPTPGFSHSPDGGLTWAESLAKRRVVGASRDRLGVVFGALADGQGGDADFSVSEDGGGTWYQRLDPYGQPTVFGPIVYGPAAGEVYLYAVSSNSGGLDSRLFMSIDDGGSWTHRPGPQVTGGAIAATQTTPSTIYVGGAARTPGEPQLYVSSDGATWAPVATFPGPLSANGGNVVNEITALVIDPADPQRIWVGFRYPDYVLYSGDGGVHWEARSLGLGAGPITSIVLDPGNAATLLATQAGGGIFRTGNSGGTWTAMDDGLHEDVLLRADFDPFVANRIYASTGSGLVRANVTIAYPAGGRRAIEFHHHDFNHYFVSADLAEIAGLDNGTIAGWTRTGEGFRVAEGNAPGNSPVCRFFSVGFAPVSSHFYTPYPQECESLKAHPKWIYEQIAFGLALPDPPPGRGCPPGTRALHRLFNNLLGGAPNHRLTTSDATMDSMIGQGWVFEGEVPTLVSACVPY